MVLLQGLPKTKNLFVTFSFGCSFITEHSFRNFVAKNIIVTYLKQ